MHQSLSVLFVALLGSVVGAQTTTRVSVSSSGLEANGPTTSVALSETGRWVAFQSGATNLVSGDTNGVDDIFLHDRNNGTTTRVSVPFGGGEANGVCSFPSISGDGGWIAFQSTATNLVPGPGYGPISQIYVHDRVSGLTMAASSAAGNGPSSECAISLDGKWVVFQSDASNLVPGDGNGTTDVFLAEVGVGTTTRLSVLPSGVGGNGPSTKPAVSADGRYVTFVSSATNLVAGDTNGVEDVFLCDTTTGLITRVSLDSAGAEGNGASTAGTISPDGGYVAFASDASNLVLSDGNGARDIFVRVLATGLTVRASVSSSGVEANGNCFFPSVSWWGDTVSFHTLATNLVPGVDPNGARDVFTHDLSSGVTTLISTGTGGWGNNTSWLPKLSAGGRVVAYPSLASNLVTGDTNSTWDAFVRSTPKKTWYIDVAGTPPGTGTPSDPFTSIQYAIGQPQVVDSDTLLVVAGTYNENLDFRGKALELRSLAGQAATVLDGVAGMPVVTLTNIGSARALVEGFTIRSYPDNFYPFSGAILSSGSAVRIESCHVLHVGAGPSGPGIHHTGGSLDLVQCSVTDYSTGDCGGGLYAESCSILVDGCGFARNTAQEGGGMYLSRVTGSIRNTTITEHDHAWAGMGIYIDGDSSNIDMSNCQLWDNGLQNGVYQGAGTIYLAGGLLDIADSSFINNWNSWGGGAIYSAGGVLTLTDCVLKDNFGDGGGIQANGTTIGMTDTLVEGNLGGFGNGGGALLYGCTTTLVGCTFRANVSGIDDHHGGGLYVGGGTLFARECTIDSNIACRGGGLYLSSVAATIEESVISGNHSGGCNQAGTGGAGVYIGGVVVPHFVRCVFLDNTAAGYSNWEGGTAVKGVATLTNCTLVRSNPEQWLTGVEDATLVNCILRGVGNPELGPGASATYSNVLGGAPGAGNIDADPLFWAAAAADFHLQPGSPCIDAGDPTSPPDPDGSVSDMGAFPLDPNHCALTAAYCTAGTTGNGCNARIGAVGIPSTTLSSGFDVTVDTVEGQKQGIIFWGRSSALAPWGPKYQAKSYRCVSAPVTRTGTQDSGGTVNACDGTFTLDFNTWMQANPNKAPAPGEVIYMQAWFRDPPSPKTTSLSDALVFVVDCP